MKLISCHVENFGKLSGFSLDFHEGCNAICEENGWGKSTLAAFLRVMLYGFDREGKRNPLENERERYRPWQKGVYGGELVFEAQKPGGMHDECVRYRIRRVFGAKSRDDELELTCADTNLPCTDFAEPLGESLFQLDAASFERTIFLSQNDCASETTDRINAKIGNLTEHVHDMAQYEDAVKRLEDKLNRLTPRRASGAIKQHKALQTELMKKLRDGAGLPEALRELEGKRREELAARKALEQEQKEVQRRQGELGRYLDQKQKRKEYARLMQECRERKAAQEEAGGYFKGQLPQAEALREYAALANEAVQAEQSLKLCELTPDEQAQEKELTEKFLCRDISQLPSEQRLAQMLSVAQEYEAAVLESRQQSLSAEERDRLARYRERYGNGVPAKDELDGLRREWSESREIKAALSAKRVQADTLEAMEKQADAARQREVTRQKNAVFCMAAGATLAVAGLLLLVFQLRIPGAVAGAAGLCVLFFGILQRTAARQNLRLQNAGENVSGEKLGRLREEVARDEEIIAAVTRRAQIFCVQYGVRFDEGLFPSALGTMQSETEEFARLSVREEENLHGALQRTIAQKRGLLLDFFEEACPGYVPADGTFVQAVREAGEMVKRLKLLREKKVRSGHVRKNLEEKSASVKEYLGQLGFEAEPELTAQFSGLERKLLVYEERHAEYVRSCDALAAFEHGQTESELAELRSGSEFENEPVECAGADTLEQLSQRARELTELIHRRNELIAGYERQENETRERYLEWQETQEALEALNEKISDEEKRFALFEKTKEFLGQAKTSFTARYTEPVMKGFRKYYRMLTGSGCEHVQMDADTRLKVVEQGLAREVEFQSAGRRDLMGICMRMALVDAMYQAEKPFLILDDPFVNLDEVTTQGGMELLENASKEYQMIYFTCHNSRVPGDTEGSRR